MVKMSTGAVEIEQLHIKTKKKDADGNPLKQEVKIFGPVRHYRARLDEIMQRHMNLIINRQEYAIYPFMPPSQYQQYHALLNRFTKNSINSKTVNFFDI